MAVEKLKTYLSVVVVVIVIFITIIFYLRITPNDNSQKVTTSITGTTAGLYGFAGRIENIGNNYITVLTDQKQFFIKNPVWKVIVTPQTKIKVRYIDEALIHDDTEEGYGYSKPFDDKEISFEELKPGDYISVSTLENIINKTETVADEIIKIIIKR
jgi:hypothetical protein